MSYYDDDKNKIRRRKVSSNNINSNNVDNKKIESYNSSKSEINRSKTIKQEYKASSAYKSGPNSRVREEERKISRERSTKSRSNRKKKQKNKFNLFSDSKLKLIKSALVVFLVLAIGASSIGLVAVSKAIKDSPKVTKELIYSSYINENPTPIEEMPRFIKQAVVSIEDERFYNHNGVDLWSLVRSFLNNIFTDSVQGGSTVEMQLSKNILTNDDRSMDRKIKDMYNALQMNKIMDKDEIMEAYLNNIYFGRSSYGVAEASEAYFGIPVSDLSLAQSAMLVGITNNPLIFSQHSEAKERQETILYKMHELGYITDAQYKEALREAIPFISEIE